MKRPKNLYQRVLLIVVLILLTTISIVLPSAMYVIPWTVVLLILGQFFCQAAVDIIHDYLDYLRLKDKK